MEVAARHSLWREEPRRGTDVVLRMTSSTGLSVQFVVRFIDDHRDFTVSWGDGAEETHSYVSGDYFINHTYRDYGTYNLHF